MAIGARKRSSALASVFLSERSSLAPLSVEPASLPDAGRGRRRCADAMAGVALSVKLHVAWARKGALLSPPRRPRSVDSV